MPTLLAILLALAAPDTTPTTCTYDTWAWSTTHKRAVDHQHVVKPYADLTDEEKAPDFATTGCTLCREDQVKIRVAGAPAVLVCKSVAPGVEQALREAIAAGARIETLVGYRVGKSGGPIRDGKRTQYGGHAYGQGLDINPQHNGLYGHCARRTVPRTSADVAGCKLRIGGAWRPEVDAARTLTADGPIVQAFVRVLNWRWGGARTDATRDFMHVSGDVP